MIHAALVAITLASPAAGATDVSLDGLVEGQSVHGFTPRSVYLDDADTPIGARFVHDKTGFTFDYLRIESAPQGFIWVNTFPTSDKGEPHTQEHLLLGKGDRGRKLGSEEAMALAESSAFTDQWRTCYHFHTVAGHDVFWPVFEGQLDATLNPDYTDEEIRREVRNFGVDKSDDGALRLEEKGTVYNEMVRAYESSDQVVWRAALHAVYGSHHPLSFESGGYPDAIRTMTPADIRTFHDAAYHLANMGMIGAFPSSMPLASVLDHTGEILVKESGRTGVVSSEANLPKPAPLPEGAVEVVPFPYSDATSPGPMVLAWPAVRSLDEDDRVLLGLFLDAFAGDESTTLYKKLIDGKTRAIDLGASAVASQLSDDQGEPVFLWITGVKPEMLDGKTVTSVRALVHGELARIAALPAGDPELAAFDARVQSRVVDLRRQLDKFLDTPPGFGVRGTSTSWINHLHDVNRTGGFKKSLTLKPALAGVEQALASPASNPWHERIKAWGLLDEPFGIAAKPSPQKRAKIDADRKARIDTELARLSKSYGTPDPQATLARFRDDSDAAGKILEDAAAKTTLPALVASLPMTFDDELKYASEDVGGVPSLRATFDSMASTRVSLALRVDGVPEDDLLFLALFPTLLTDSGVVDGGVIVPADEVRERLRKEVLELSSHISENLKSGRTELVLSGAGNTPEETKAAVAWMRHVLLGPDWRAANLPRLRDVVDQALTSMRQRMSGSEEGWVDDPRDAWWKQTSPLHLHADSFLTQLHDLHRLKWMLAGNNDADSERAARAIEILANASGADRAHLVTLAANIAGTAPATTSSAPTPGETAWQKEAREIIEEEAHQPKEAPPPTAALALIHAAGKDLAEALPELPDGSLAADWAYLCKEMASDLRAGPKAGLARLESVRKNIVVAGNARLVIVGSTAHAAAIKGDVLDLVGKLDKAKPARAKYSSTRAIAARLSEHDAKGAGATFVGLVDPATSSGVFLNAAPGPDWFSKTDDQVLDYLAAGSYAGHGAHSMFMKTWAAGLAYSNGLHPQPWAGRVEYYAERCPLLPQTLRFVIDQLSKQKPDDNIARYAVAGAFSSRVADDYETRASAMAANLVDGETPDVIRAFRAHVLAVAKRGDFTNAIFSRLPKVYGSVLPGYGKPVDGAAYFVIGPEAQLVAYEAYLKGAVTKDTVLHRLYPRDFWIPAHL